MDQASSSRCIDSPSLCGHEASTEAAAAVIRRPSLASSSPSAVLSEVSRVLDAGPHAAGPIAHLRKRTVDDVLADDALLEAEDKRRRQSGGGYSGRMAVRPWNYEDFLQRLQTFKAAFWFAKPAMISAMECSRLGWCNSGADAVSCSGCAAQLKHDTVVYSAGAALRRQLELQHERFCGWIDNASPEAFLVFPDETSATVRDKYFRRVRSLVQGLEHLESTHSVASLFDFTTAKSNIQKCMTKSPNGKFLGSAQRIVDGILGTSTFGSDLPLRRLQTAIKDGEDESALQLLLSSSLLEEESTAISDSPPPPDRPPDIMILSLAVALFGWEVHVDNRHYIIRCGICGSGAEFAPLNPRPCNVVRDHRFYCPWVNETSHSEGTLAAVGWKQCASVVFGASVEASEPARAPVGLLAAASQEPLSSMRDPVASFNRINSVISMMCNPPAPHAPLSTST